MARDPPSSDSESSEDSDDLREYRYESEGEEQLGTRARALLREANGDYRLARASLLAYTRNDVVYLPPFHPAPTPAPSPTSVPPPVVLPTQANTSHSSPRPRPRSRAHPPAPQSSSRAQSLPPASQPTQVMLVTPSSTASTPRYPTGPSPGIRLAGPSPRNNPAIDQPQHSNNRRLRTRCFTPVYSHLVATGMVRYFKIEDGISYLPGEDVLVMLYRIKEDSEWLGEPRDVDTSVFDIGGALAIHRPTPDAVSKTWYSVTAGSEVGVFTTWEVVAARTQGVPNAMYRSFRTRLEAYRSFQLALVLGTVRLLPPPP